MYVESMTSRNPSQSLFEPSQGYSCNKKNVKKLDVTLWQHDHDYSERNYEGFTHQEKLVAATHYIKKLQQQVHDLQSQRFCLDRFSTDPDLISFYTGFKDYKILRATFIALQPTAERMICCSLNYCNSNFLPANHQSFCHGSLALIDQFFLFLVKLKQDPSDQDLAYRFGVSVSCVEQVILAWANYLYAVLGAMPIWSSRAQVNDTLPTVFKTLFHKTRVILHSVVLRVEAGPGQKPHSVKNANCNEITSCKGLLGISPVGGVSFVSTLFATPISNKELTVRSLISRVLDPGDQVVVDEHFPIEKELQEVGAYLMIIPSRLKRKNLNTLYSEQKQCIEKLRSHVRCAIERANEYRILDNIIPLNIASQLWTICCLLTNFKGPLR
ncbi:uncharacterized protein LOC110985813 [Acanthaster planci]|uniref:Uncharacterized protein LOC110985813 n=1 Tax=Acanthaster planci TaxID=133434 RepID=A0A8B7ZD29_ACAPL|nr:uncharacterized protein LOC110985813 [Acanthaster planci]XP_022102877.1 uncharacterized protein LOC110985813 [Acanthaster planci]